MSTPTLPVSYATVEQMHMMLPAAVVSVTTITSATLAHFLGEAQAEVDAALAKRYSLPLGAQVPFLTALTLDLAGYRLITRRLVGGVQGDAIKELADRYDSARQRLKDLEAGAMSLVTAQGSPVLPDKRAYGVWGSHTSYDPTFDEDAWAAQSADPDKLDAIARRR